jgi:hypothetical protein
LVVGSTGAVVVLSSEVERVEVLSQVLAVARCMRALGFAGGRSRRSAERADDHARLGFTLLYQRETDEFLGSFRTR